MVEIFFKIGGIPSKMIPYADTLIRSDFVRKATGGPDVILRTTRLFNPNLSKATPRDEKRYLRRTVLRTFGDIMWGPPPHSSFITSPVAEK